MHHTFLTLCDGNVIKNRSLFKKFIYKEISENLQKTEYQNWVDFINILRSHFSYKSALHSFAQLFSGYILALYFVWHKNIGKNVVRKMLMKLTPGCFSVPVLLVILS